MVCKKDKKHKSTVIIFLLIHLGGLFCAVHCQVSPITRQNIVNPKAPLTSDRLIVLQQIGNANNLYVQQVSSSQNVTRLSQYGYKNQANLTMVAASRNTISLHQRGQENHIDFSLSEGVGHQIHISQDYDLNLVEVKLGKTTRANIGISQRGGGYVKMDFANNQPHRGLNLRGLTIKQSKGGVPIVIKN